MNKDVIITVTGYQTDEEGNTDSNKTEHFAQYYLRDGKHYVVYEDEMNAKSARYKISHRSLEVVRNGDIYSKMVFEAGKTFEGMYRTPYGRMMLKFEVNGYSLYENDGSLKAEADYKILSEDVLISRNRIVVDIKNKTI